MQVQRLGRASSHPVSLNHSETPVKDDEIIDLNMAAKIKEKNVGGFLVVQERGFLSGVIQRSAGI